jgi:hypothetical protein
VFAQCDSTTLPIIVPLLSRAFRTKSSRKLHLRRPGTGRLACPIEELKSFVLHHGQTEAIRLLVLADMLGSIFVLLGSAENMNHRGRELSCKLGSSDHSSFVATVNFAVADPFNAKFEDRGIKSAGEQEALIFGHGSRK